MIAAAKSVVLAPAARDGIVAAMPAVFVVLWSTGFIGAKYGLPYAGPLTFLALRFGIVAAIMLAISRLGGAWPKDWRLAGHAAAVGLLIQGAYLGGVYVAIAGGLSAGLSALVVGLQPVLTAAFAGLALGERVAPRQWLGVGLGVAGIVLVLSSKLALDLGHLEALGAAIVALLGITAGTLYQKRFCAGIELRAATLIHNAAAGSVMLLLALLFEDMRLAWNAAFAAALAWLCLVLSIGTFTLLLWLLRRGAAARVASLFFLVPPVTAFMGFLLFGETLTGAALVGMVLTALGVALVNRG